jgi:hypothetical protein
LAIENGKVGPKQEKKVRTRMLVNEFDWDKGDA